MLRNRPYRESDPRLVHLLQVIENLAEQGLRLQVASGRLPVGSHRQYTQAYNRDLPPEEHMTVSGLRRVLAALARRDPRIKMNPPYGPVYLEDPQLARRVLEGIVKEDNRDAEPDSH